MEHAHRVRESEANIQVSGILGNSWLTLVHFSYRSEMREQEEHAHNLLGAFPHGGLAVSALLDLLHCDEGFI